jgi:hypothetical protein
MRFIVFFLSILFCFTLSNAQNISNGGAVKSNRIEKILFSEWTFNYFPSETDEKGYEGKIFDDSRWSAVSLPHTWNTYETIGEGGQNKSNQDETYWVNGWGWYRKHFVINKGYADRKVFVELNGIQKYCKIWINGKYLGDHFGRYGSFDFDISSFITPGEDNVLAIAVRNKPEVVQNGKQVSGSYGGIFGNIKIVLRNKLYIPMQGSASHEGGSQVLTPGVSLKEGSFEVSTWVKNENTQKKNCILQTTIYDKENKVIQVLKSETAIKPLEIYRFTQKGKPIKKPHLWSVNDPYLYKVLTEVIDGKDIMDSNLTTFGFKIVKWDDKENSLLLNDNVKLNPVKYEPTRYPLLGDALPESLLLSDFSKFVQQSAGKLIIIDKSDFNSVPYDMIDNSGIPVAILFPDNSKESVSDAVYQQYLSEIIRNERNHPGLLIRGFANSSDNTKFGGYVLLNDSARIVANIKVTTAHNDGNQVNYPAQSTVVKPAKLVLKSSQATITADRRSVCFLTLYVTDSEGNNTGGKFNLKWKVTGPATISGPKLFSVESTDNQSDVSVYKSFPIVNIIRSTGEPGKICVTVLSPGLASGSFVINAEVPPAIDNSIVNEPVLKYNERRQTGKRTLIVSRLEEVPDEIVQLSAKEDISFSKENNQSKAFNEYIIKNNPSIDTTSVEFRFLSKLLVSQIMNNNGILSVEDYNFNAGNFNNCRLIAEYINATKLPPLFKDGLRQYYSDMIINKGIEKNAGDEMNWLNWIPSGGTVVYVTDEAVSNPQKGVVYTKKTDLINVISSVYPQFVNFSKEAKDRAFIFIGKMNPYLKATNSDGKVVGRGEIEVGTNLTYTAEKNKPILIPLAKFISE